MPKINVYLPDDLAAAVREAGLPISPICQRALAEAVRATRTAREAIVALRDVDREPALDSQLGASLAARITDHLRVALARAHHRAGSGAPVEPRHLLLGVVDEPDNLGLHVLTSLEVDVSGLREAASDGVSAPCREPEHGADAAELLAGLSPAARRVLAAALEGALELGHGFLGCEHLVLGLAGLEGRDAATPAETAPAAAAEETATALLAERGVTPERVRRAISISLGAATLGYARARAQLGPGLETRLDGLTRRLDALERRVAAGGL